MADINKSFSLKVLADVTAYQAELAKIPGVTEKQAAAAALRMEREMVKAAKATGAAAQAAASGGADALGKSFGQAKEQVALVAAGASRISPELGAAVNAASSVLGVFKAMASPAGAIAAAGTLAAAAWVKFSGDVAESEQRMNDAAKTAIKAQLGIIDSGYYVNQALEAQDKASLLKRKGTWVQFARDYAEIFSLGGLNPIANAVLKKLDEYEQGIQRNITALEGMRDRNIELARSEQEVEKARRSSSKAVQVQIADVKELAQVQMESAEEVTAVKIAALHDQVDAAFAAAADEMRAAEQAAALEMQMAREKSELQKDTALDTAAALSSVIKSVFGENKAAMYATAIIDTAVAVAAALANPPGPPYSIPQSIAAGAAGAAQVATIASTNIAHSGLAFDPSSGSRQAMAPDESVWKLRKNEAVLTRRGVEGLGGYGQVRRLNAGQAPGMGGRFVGVTQWKHKAMDAAIGENVARPAAVRTEMKAIASTSGRVGHRLRSTT